MCREATQSGHGGKGMLPPAVWGRGVGWVKKVEG